MERSPTNSIERRKRQRLPDPSQGALGAVSSWNEFDTNSTSCNTSTHHSKQGHDIGSSLPRFPTGILGGRGGGGGGGGSGGAASTAWLLSGPWLELCSRLNLPIPTLSGLEQNDYDCIGKGQINKDISQLVENWKMIYSSNVSCTMVDVEMGKWDLRVPFVAGVLRKIRKPREKDVVAQLVDPTGPVECFFQEDALVKYGADIGVGTAVLAKDVAVWLSHSPGLCRNLCLHPDAIQFILPPDTSRPGEDELNRLQRLSEDMSTIHVTHSSSEDDNTTPSRVVYGESKGNRPASALVVNDTDDESSVLLPQDHLNEEPPELIRAEVLRQQTLNPQLARTSTLTVTGEEKEHSPSLLSYVEKTGSGNTQSKMNVHPSPGAAVAALGPPLHVKCEEQQRKCGYNHQLEDDPQINNKCSIIHTPSANPSRNSDFQQQSNPSHNPFCHVGSSSALLSHCKGGGDSGSNSTTRCDMETTTALIQKEGVTMLPQDLSFTVENPKVSRSLPSHEAKKKNIDTNAEPEPNNININNNSCDNNSINSVQEQNRGPASSSRGWTEVLNEQNIFESLLDEEDN